MKFASVFARDQFGKCKQGSHRTSARFSLAVDWICARNELFIFFRWTWSDCVRDSLPGCTKRERERDFHPKIPKVIPIYSDLLQLLMFIQLGKLDGMNAIHSIVSLARIAHLA